MAASTDDDAESLAPPEAKQLDEYDSAFEYDSDHEEKVAKRKDLSVKTDLRTSNKHKGRANKHVFTEEYTKNAGISQSYHRTGVDAYARHKQLINNYFLYYKGSTAILQRDTSRDRTDLDVIRENHKFLWNDDDDADSTWGRRMAKKYYDKLFKEYCIADLSLYKENRVAMRWRIEREVVDGKGQFVCGNKTCVENEGLKSWEVNFAYLEEGEKRNALVKLRLCEECSAKLNYKHKRKEAKRAKKRRSTITSEGDDASSSKSPRIDTGEGTSETGKKPVENKNSGDAEDELWKGPVKLDDKSREEEFNEYFEDLFL